MTQAVQSTHVPFFPSSLNAFFSVSYNGKTHELEAWQKTAILITGIAGLALFGIGVLLGFGLSYYFRNRLVEQLAAESSILPKPPIQLQPPQTDEPKETNPVVVAEPPKPVKEAETPPQTKQPGPVVVAEPPKPSPDLLPVLTKNDADEGLKALVERLINLSTLRIGNRDTEMFINKDIQPIDPTTAIETDRLIKQRVENVRGAIDARQKARGLAAVSEELINDQVLGKWSMEGRHFISIQKAKSRHEIPEFSPLLLPKGIYCVYHTDNMYDLTGNILISDEYNQMMINEFGIDKIFHLVICMYKPQDSGVVPQEKIHKHQLELYSGVAISDETNARCIRDFMNHLVKEHVN